MPRLPSIAGAALALLTALPAAPLAAEPGSAAGGRETREPGPGVADVADVAVVVVLIGAANRSAELSGVLTELLMQEGVHPQFVAEPRFERSALLDANADDERVWVFVALEGAQRARLYFRGPFGERFLLRELSLRAGLDELGRELIARVVETSTVALLHSREGLSRAQAEAGLERADAQSAAAQAKPAAEPEVRRDVTPAAVPADRADRDEPTSERADQRSAQQERAWLLGVRLLAGWAGPDLGARYGAGIEAGVRLLDGPRPQLRARIAFEPSLPQAIDAAGVEAAVMSWPLRLGLDLGGASGVHGFWLGASAGVDVVRVAVDRARDPSLSLSEPDGYLLPAVRLELRYELALGRALLSAGLLLDVPLARTHYDVIADGERARVATPWRVRPGLGLGCGARF